MISEFKDVVEREDFEVFEKNGKDYLYMVFPDEEKKALEISGVRDVSDNSKRRYVQDEKFIEKTYCKDGIKHLIEIGYQLNKNKENGYVDESDFSNCIFLLEVDFTGLGFTKLANFEGSTFTKKAVFAGSGFTKKANFFGATFIKEAYFLDSTFKEEAYFSYSTFTKKAYFSNSTFTKKAYFFKSTFKEKISFEFSRFGDILFLNNINNEKKEEKFSLNMKSAVLDRIDLSDTVIDNAENRETFLVLKNIAIKQNDRVSALDFHKKEMNKYFADLKWKKEWQDKIILGFEKVVSNFGTSVWRSVLFFVFFNLVIFVLYYLKFSECLNLSKAVELVIPFKAETYTIFHVITLIFNPILIYEIIKSFRKYSRVL